jgi:N-acetylglucosamine-6-phosphate deacetylase
MSLALTGARIFDGTHIVDGHSVVIAGKEIAAVVPDGDIPADAKKRRVEGLLAPGFIDVQVNGGGGVLFNDERTAAGIAAIGRAHRPYGTTGFMPTFITDTREHMREAIEAARAALEGGVPGALGIHIEGPFLSPERKGVHDPNLFRRMEEADFELVTSLGRGRTLMTVAPERVPPEAIARLVATGVIVAAGHTAASFETVVAARAAGLSGFTHLFNAMPPLAGRAPGPVGAALDDPDSFAGIIVDLFHVSAASLRVAIAAHGWQRMVLVTDAMPSVGSDLTEFLIDGNVITRKDGTLLRGDGTIAGSDLDMATAVRNCVTALGLPIEAALHMASRAPAEYLRLGDELGRIAPGYRADLALLDDDLGVVETWIDGVASNE